MGMGEREYLVKPWAHQLAAIEKARGQDSFALFFEQGCGKTSTLIHILQDKFQEAGGLFKTLILCPPIVIENWRNEIAHFSEISPHKVICLTGSARERVETVREAGGGGVLSRIYVTNYQALLMPELFELFQKMKFTGIVLDESHKIKSHEAKTTKAILKLSKFARYKFILSGTPILNSAMDLWSQFKFLDGGKTLEESFYKFRGIFFDDLNRNVPKNNYFPNFVIKPGAFEQIQKIIAPKTSRVLKKDCLDLPPLVRQIVPVELTPEQKRVYTTLEKEMVAELSQGSLVITDMALTKLLRLQQIISGYVTDENEAVVRFKGSHRASCLREVLESIGPLHKVIIWAVFKPNYEDIRDVLRGLGIVHVEVHGGVSQADKFEAVRRFNEDPGVRVLVGHPASGGIGINLIEASYSIFFSRSFSLENDLQAEARNYRAGSQKHEKVTRIDLVTPGTVDEVVLAALSGKQKVSDAILNFYQPKGVHHGNQEKR